MLKTIKEIKDWLEEVNIDRYVITEDLGIEVHTSVDLRSYGLTELPVQFISIAGDFDCSQNILTTLVGCPETVDGKFYCSDNKLKDLIGGPKRVNKDYICSDNQLESLKGAPEYVGKDFCVQDNDISDLNYFPALIEGDVYFNDNPLTNIFNLKGECDGTFRHSHKFQKIEVLAEHYTKFTHSQAEMTFYSLLMNFSDVKKIVMHENLKNEMQDKKMK